MPGTTGVHRSPGPRTPTPSSRRPPILDGARQQRRQIRSTRVTTKSRAGEELIQPRRLTRRGLATRDRIVRAAATLMYTKGVNGTTLDDVRIASGTSKSQLYR